MSTPIDRVEVAVLELWAKANPANDGVAAGYRHALRDVLHVLDAEQGVTQVSAVYPRPISPHAATRYGMGR